MHVNTQQLVHTESHNDHNLYSNVSLLRAVHFPLWGNLTNVVHIKMDIVMTCLCYNFFYVGQCSLFIWNRDSFAVMHVFVKELCI